MASAAAVSRSKAAGLVGLAVIELCSHFVRLSQASALYFAGARCGGAGLNSVDGPWRCRNRATPFVLSPSPVLGALRNHGPASELERLPASVPRHLSGGA